MFTNPDSIAYHCPDCGVNTRANRRTGLLLYSHSVPGDTTICPASGRGVISAESGAPLQLQHHPDEPTQPAST